MCLNTFFFFPASLVLKNVDPFPKIDFRPLITHFWSNLPEKVLYLLFGCPSMTAAMVNIADVPFTLGSGRIEDQFISLETEDTVLPICLDDIQKSFWQGEISRNLFYPFSP